MITSFKGGNLNQLGLKLSSKDAEGLGNSLFHCGFSSKAQKMEDKKTTTWPRRDGIGPSRCGWGCSRECIDLPRKEQRLSENKMARFIAGEKAAKVTKHG